MGIVGGNGGDQHGLPFQLVGEPRQQHLRLQLLKLRLKPTPGGTDSDLGIGAAFRCLSLKKQLAWAKSKMQEFEARYHTTLDQLEADGLPDEADYAMHKDYIEWYYWSRVMERTRKTLDALSAFSP